MYLSCSSAGPGPRTGFLLSLALADGRPRWIQPVGEPNLSSPVVIRDRVFVVDFRGVVYSVSGADGTIHWSTPTHLRYASQCHIVHDATGVYVTGQAAGKNARSKYSVVKLSDRDGRISWKYEDVQWGALAIDPRTGNPVLLDGDGRVRILDAGSGQTIRASAPTGGLGMVLPAGDHRLLIFTSSETKCLDLGTFKVLWRKPVSLGRIAVGRRRIPVATRGGDLFLASTTESTLYCLALQNGDLRWKQPLPGNAQPYVLVPGPQALMAGLVLSGGGGAELDWFNYRTGSRVAHAAISGEVREGYEIISGRDNRGILALDREVLMFSR